jgi:hypothetical protein
LRRSCGSRLLAVRQWKRKPQAQLRPNKTMAKKKARSKKTAQKKRSVGGPFLACAVFCDSVLRGEDGTMTAVRMIDKVTLTIPASAPQNVPSEENALLTSVEGLIGFKKGDAGTKHKVKLVMNAPSGKSKELKEQLAEFRSELHSGYNLRIKTTIAVTETGLYWLDVYLDSVRMTRMPLLITVNRAEPEPPAAAKPETRRRKSIDLG